MQSAHKQKPLCTRQGLIVAAVPTILRNFCSSCLLEHAELSEDLNSMVVRPGPIGLHLCVARASDETEQPESENDEVDGLFIEESDCRALRIVEKRRISQVQTVFDLEVRL